MAERTIRAADLKDAAGIAAIYNQSIEARNATMDTEPVGPSEIAAWLQKQGPREYLGVVENGTGLAGWGIIKRYHPRPGYARAAETSVYIDSGQTGRGHGTAMQLHLIDVCRDASYHHLVAKIWARNDGSIRMHERLGYRVVGVQREIGHVEGDWKDVAILELVLD